MYRWMPLWDIEVFILCPFPLPFKLTLGSPQGMAIVVDASQEVSEVSGEDKTWTWVGSTDPPPPHFGLAMDAFFLVS